MKILGITLARGGSKGIPKKNIMPINNIPLIDYTLREAIKVKAFSRYIVSTDCPEIQDHCLSYGVQCPFLRPADLASDTASSSDALIHALKYCEAEDGKYDYIVELMCTNPFKTHLDINACIAKLTSTNADSVIAVTQLEDHHPARIKKIVDDKIQDFCVPELSGRRQDLVPKAYIRNGSIYALSREALLSGLRFGGPNSRPYIMPPERSINIDTPIDLMIAESLLK